ncbi:hypothetical protein KM043_014304 [Ampulex compressa]|nr:hypothetical protein KM043_014304 [Ampulex compressa]
MPAYPIRPQFKLADCGRENPNKLGYRGVMMPPQGELHTVAQQRSLSPEGPVVQLRVRLRQHTRVEHKGRPTTLELKADLSVVERQRH